MAKYQLYCVRPLTSLAFDSHDEALRVCEVYRRFEVPHEEPGRGGYWIRGIGEAPELTEKEQREFLEGLKTAVDGERVAKSAYAIPTRRQDRRKNRKARVLEGAGWGLESVCAVYDKYGVEYTKAVGCVVVTGAAIPRPEFEQFVEDIASAVGKANYVFRPAVGIPYLMALDAWG